MHQKKMNSFCFLFSVIGAAGYLYLYSKESMHQNVLTHEIKVGCYTDHLKYGILFLLMYVEIF